MSRAQISRDRAAQWIIAKEQPDWTLEDEVALAAWLSESDLNKASYWRLEQSWSEADRIGALGRGIRSGSEDGGRVRRWRRWASVGLAASLLLVVVLGIYQGPRLISQPTSSDAAATYNTALGARRTVGLSDGSRIELNTATVVRTALDKRRREVWLDEGEAYFEVAHMEGRPFVVHAGTRQIVVLGTKFSVRRTGDEVAVAVLEGRVRVDEIQDARPVRSTTIIGGDMALTQGAATLVAAHSEERVENALAWRDGMLSFRHERLGDIASEFNRYNRRKLELVDVDAAELRIGGAFPSDQPDAFARLLRDAYGFKIEETPEEIRISR